MVKSQHTRSELIKIAKKHNLVLDMNPASWHDYYSVSAPAGYHFTNDIHERIEPHRNTTEWKKEAIDDLVKFIKDCEGRKPSVLTHCKKNCDCGWDE